ncbi:Conidial yellow pigment biosynthesis polyketide synthase [Cytospora mali]|uniref:Conidial yellow pigment biosynthesis polyketide synthase n=1 Tax=Cytospora mali TaxID=578113 RepID=A0A194V8G9_CYTMA|nr:Conidial yellow pigment biosynthesis polyketide synthase [Valsa mali var. pyri (nom. inval.)]
MGSLGITSDEFLVFGPQCLTFDQTAADELRAHLISDKSMSWSHETLRGLASHWEELKSAVPELENSRGEEALGDLNHWLITGEFGVVNFPLPNILLTPLVVTLHLAQYQNLRSSNKISRHAMETLGLCTGLLSAAAVSCSENDEELQRHGAGVVRLAMLLGAVVDSKDASLGPEMRAKSYSVAWASPGMKIELSKILQAFPEEEKRATVTTTERSSSSLLQKLKASGFITVDLTLRGYFHWDGHRATLQSILRFCGSHPDFRLIECSKLPRPTRSNDTGQLITHGQLHETIIKAILTEQSNWIDAFKNVQIEVLRTDSLRLVSFGPERCVPSSLTGRLGPGRFTQVTSIEIQAQQGSRELDISQDDIAVIGMACHLPGAADLNEFWTLLSAGTSQHVEVPQERFGFQTPWREADARRAWYGNFLHDHDTFDERFFKKSPRELQSTDPQQRLILQVAYQAVEQSGYFSSPWQDKHIGCYLGFCLGDYERNIACHAANAYSATGNPKAFAAGKISHYFGWTGPGLTIDTACSSSAVAIHMACKSILSGECSAALAGGVNVMTSPEWFQNLAGASFLSPTGQCKPFDASADGYCRGEAVGAVFLKKLSSALAGGDRVFGVIAGSAVYQNQNCTAITVPNAISLSGLFRDVTRRARFGPMDVSYVEAHGTGTPVGDPAEYESIRRVFGGPGRADKLSIGSVKGLLGHSEAASGIVALLKILLMIHYKGIPPQASFQTINPELNSTPSDKMEIATGSLHSWDRGFRAALINNYGASGSNATLLVTQPPKIMHHPLSATRSTQALRYPFYFSGLDSKALTRYYSKFLAFIQSHKDASLADLSFQLSRQANRTLPCYFTFDTGSISELEQMLTDHVKNVRGVEGAVVPSTRPVILCFGGQISDHIGLDRHIFEEVCILRRHLDHCNDACQSFGVTIYPEIFQRSPLDNRVNLQTALFSLQYACAKSWIDCGLEVAAVIGHSFGELTALCISGSLPLTDALQMVVARARLIDNSWGTEKGSMVAVEADEAEVHDLLAASARASSAEPEATIACFNGPRSFTLAGSSRAINAVAQIGSEYFPSIKMKRLNVTNAYHCGLVDPIMPDLERLSQGLKFSKPTIPMERATYTEDNVLPGHNFIAQHMREPVYFHHAVQRLSKRYPSAVWLEAGSNSTITAMASRAIGTGSSTNYFQNINITTEGSFRHLTAATTGLWRQGVHPIFWPHHKSQSGCYAPVILPPYQFSKSRHWMELKMPPKDGAVVPQSPSQAQDQNLLWSLVGFTDQKHRSVRFQVHLGSKRFRDIVKGHVVIGSAPLCPSTLQLDIAFDALISLDPKYSDGTFQPQLSGLTNHAPMVLGICPTAWLDAQAEDENELIWSWQIASGKDAASSLIPHVSGKIVFRPTNDSHVHDDFLKYERLVGRQRCLSILNADDADDAILGRNIYSAFSGIVQYSDDFRGLHKLVGKGLESSGRVIREYCNDSWLDFRLGDCFCQVAGIFLNTMTERTGDEMYISDKIDQWIRSPRLTKTTPRPGEWQVYSCHHRLSNKEFVSDVFSFDPRDGSLMEIILGIHYIKVNKSALSKTILRLVNGNNASGSKNLESMTPLALPTENDSGTSFTLGAPPISSSKVKLDQDPNIRPMASTPRHDILRTVKGIIADLSGLETHEIRSEAQLVDLGIDSLMGMELAREIEGAFKCAFDAMDLMALTDLPSLVMLVEKVLGVEGPVPQEIEDIKDEQPVSRPQENGTSTSFGAIVLPSPPFDTLGAGIVLETFEETIKKTDRYIIDYGLENYVDCVLPISNKLCIAYTCDAFEQLGCPIRTAQSGQRLERIKHAPKHRQFVSLLYGWLENEARLIHVDDSGNIVRTAEPPPSASAEVLLQELNSDAPLQSHDHNLTAIAGKRLADCLVEKADGIQLIFGTPEGREAAQAMYGQSPINIVWIRQLEEFLGDLISRLPKGEGPIRILEMGSGTGGTTSRMLPLLASLEVPVQYTVSDISASLVSASRKRFKKYSFVEYRTLDIEKEAPADLQQHYHIVLATNCVHATRNIEQSTKNIRKLLRPDGFLLMLEMTQTLAWVDLIFGLVEGWWLFDDGREHALAPPAVWERTLHRAGYGEVLWTEGCLPESGIQRLILAMASKSSPRYEQDPVLLPLPKMQQPADTDLVALKAREAAIDRFVRSYTPKFVPPGPQIAIQECEQSQKCCVLITGATGSLGSHLLQYFAELSSVKTVICLNRKSSTEAITRQRQALKSRGIELNPEALSKLQVLQTDTSKPKLGLLTKEYDDLVSSVTHIVHNAWPMSITRAVDGFELQFKAMRNLLELARDAYMCQNLSTRPIAFQFISSIATVGLHPLRSGEALVPEESMEVESVLPNGYGDAKLVCERMLQETLQRSPQAFHPMAVRIGQIAGSRTSGYWNPVEHLACILKSSHTIRLLPDLKGTLSWCPVNDVACTLGELILSPGTKQPIYHIENPVRQSWPAMIRMLCEILDIPSQNVVPFDDWVSKVRSSPGSTDKENPAARLVEFLSVHFVRMSCGDLILDTTKSKTDSLALRSTGPVNMELLAYWKETGFIYSVPR